MTAASLVACARWKVAVNNEPDQQEEKSLQVFGSGGRDLIRGLRTWEVRLVSRSMSVPPSLACTINPVMTGPGFPLWYGLPNTPGTNNCTSSQAWRGQEPM